MIAAAQLRASVPFCSLPLCTLLLVGIEEEQGIPPPGLCRGSAAHLKLFLEVG